MEIMDYTQLYFVFSFIAKLDQVIAGNSEVTLILDDPAGNSFVQTLNDDGTADEGMKKKLGR